MPQILAQFLWISQSRAKPSPIWECKFALRPLEAHDPKPVESSFISDIGGRNSQVTPVSPHSMAARETGSLLGWERS